MSIYLNSSIVGLFCIYGLNIYHKKYIKKYYPYFKIESIHCKIINNDVMVYDKNYYKQNIYYPYKIIKKIDDKFIVLNYFKPVIDPSEKNDDLLDFFCFYAEKYDDKDKLYNDFFKYKKYVEPKSIYEIEKDILTFYNKIKNDEKNFIKTTIYPSRNDVEIFLESNGFNKDLYNYSNQIRITYFYSWISFFRLFSTKKYKIVEDGLDLECVCLTFNVPQYGLLFNEELYFYYHNNKIYKVEFFKLCLNDFFAF